MATSSRKSNLLAPVCAVLAAGLLGVAEAAPAPCANQEIVLEAKPLEMDYRNNNAVLRDVVITQCSVRIQADEARHQAAGSISRTATGPFPATCASRPKAAA